MVICFLRQCQFQYLEDTSRRNFRQELFSKKVEKNLFTNIKLAMGYVLNDIILSYRNSSSIEIDDSYQQVASISQEEVMTTNNQIKALVERIEKLEEEKAVIAEDIKEVYSEAKGNGFDPKIIKKIIALRKQDAKKRAEEQALLAVYMDALGMLAGTPLGKAAVEAAKSNKAPKYHEGLVGGKLVTFKEDEDLDDFD